MAHELEIIAGLASFVFDDVDGPGWHDLGRMVPASAPKEVWRKAAGHCHTISKRPVLYRNAAGELLEMPDRFVTARDDNNHAHGVVSDKYVLVQPEEIDDICDDFAALAEGQLVRSAAFTLRQGDMICSTYAYRGDGFSVAGDKHKAYMMASTTMDGSASTWFWASVIRAVCKNTVEAGLGSTKARISVRHNTKLDPDRVREQLAVIAQSVVQFKALGDALARHQMTAAQVSAFFKASLDIPQDATIDASGKVTGTTVRKFNQFRDLSRAFIKSAQERGGDRSAFTAMQAITRYGTHDITVKNGGTDENVARFDSANFGNGAAFKNKAMGLLLPLFDLKVAA